MNDAGERNQEPTQIRLQQAQSAGDVARSHELAAALTSLGAIGAAYLTFAQMSNWLRASTIELWNVNAGQLPVNTIIPTMQSWLFGLAGAMLSFLAMLMLIAAAASMLQTGVLWTPQRLVPSLDQIGPGKWRQGLSMSRVLSVTWLGLPKIAIALLVMGLAIFHQRHMLFSLANLPADQLVAGLFQCVLRVCLQVTAVLTILGVGDYGLQWLGHRRRMRMSHQEIREEQRRQGNEVRIRNL